MKLSVPHQPSGAYATIPNEFPSYQEYIAHCKRLIECSRLDLNSKEKEKIISANLPFELNENAKKGVLLLHGLYDSPCVLTDMAAYFSARGFKVRGMLLPGHGTVPGDLLHITYQDWIRWARFGLTSFRGQVDELYVGGFSTGGALAVFLALEQPTAIKKLFLFTPALELTRALSYLARFHKQSSWLLPNPHWLSVMHEIDYAKYRSFTVNSLCQVFLLAKEIKKMWDEKNMSIPSFWVVTKHDEVLRTSSLIKFFLEKATTDSQLIYYAPQQEIILDNRMTWRCSQRLKENIIDLSHVGVPVSPTQYHYGKKGDYQAVVLHELAKKHHKPHYYGSLKNINLMNRSSLVRLTYNPDFDYLTQRMDHFLQSNSST